ncbi:MAG: type II toxin-antitoxin system VapC family toxin [Chloroflexi bacterium]|nr:type II toxin-antitoxin system VapC family toxin [Chloroflexota bacterium]
MNVVDSSGWLEYFSGEGNADFFAPAIEDTEHLLVPVICIYEVFKRIMLQRDVSVARTNVSDMHEGQIVDLDASLAMSAAHISMELKLPMADSLILATARAHDAILWTQDEHFKGLDGVKYIEKKI